MKNKKKKSKSRPLSSPHGLDESEKNPSDPVVDGKDRTGNNEGVLTENNKEKIAVAKNQCSVCFKTFSTHCYLKTHMAVHDKKSGFICSQCGKSYVNVHHLRRHQLSHNDKKPHECLVCGKGYVDRRGLAVHMKTHTGEKREYFTCPEPNCNKKLLRKDAMVYHIRTHAGGMPYKCSYCPEQFKTRNDLGTHRRNHHKDIKNYLCPICATAFTKKAKLDDHMAKHTKDRPFKCSICNASMKTKTYLRVHMKNVHMQTSFHLCPYCGKKFKCKVSLVNHIKVHEGNLDFVCVDCGKAFPTKERLFQHCKTHFANKHECTECGKKFKNLDEVIKHLPVHDVLNAQSENESEKTKTFTGVSEINLHLCNLTCKLCESTFDDDMTLTEHMKQHNIYPINSSDSKGIAPSDNAEICVNGNLIKNEVKTETVVDMDSSKINKDKVKFLVDGTFDSNIDMDEGLEVKEVGVLDYVDYTHSVDKNAENIVGVAADHGYAVSKDHSEKHTSNNESMCNETSKSVVDAVENSFDVGLVEPSSIGIQNIGSPVTSGMAINVQQPFEHFQSGFQEIQIIQLLNDQLNNDS